MRKALGGFSAAVAIYVLAAGCAPDSAPVPEVLDTAVPIASPTVMLAEARRQACGTAAYGGDFRTDLPHPGVAATDGKAHFAPRWEIDTDMAYAIYQLALPNGTEILQLNLDWAIPPETDTGFTTLWIGFANWWLSTWNWQPAYDPAHVVESHAPACIRGGQVTVLVLVTGYTEAELAGLELEVSPGGDWWMYGHDRQHTGLSHYRGPRDPVLKWTYTFTNEVYGSPAIGADGTVYCGSDNGEMVAINPNGTNHWPQFVETVDFIRSSPAIDSQGQVVFGDWNGLVHALSAVDGSPTWAVPFAAGDTIVSSPLAMPDGSIYIGSHDGRLYKLDSAGQPAWDEPFATGDRVLCSPAAGADGTVYFGSDDGCLYALSPDGEELWPAPFATEDFIDSAPAINKYNVIYFGSYDGNVYAVKADGSPAWSQPFATGDWVTASPAIGPDGTIYVGSWDHNLYAINPNGTAKWIAPFTAGGPIEGAAAIDADGIIYLGSHDGKLYALEDQGNMAVKLWQYTTGGPIHQGPVLAATGTLYAGSGDYKLYALVDPDSPYLWRTELIDSMAYSGADVGRWSSLALDAAGHPHVAYYDSTNGDVCYASGPGSWSIETVAAMGDVGGYISLAVDPAGAPHIAFHDYTNGWLRYAWTDGDWHIEHVEYSLSGGGNLAGWYNSMIITAEGQPVIRYIDGETKYMYQGFQRGEVWEGYRLNSTPMDCIACVYNSEDVAYTCGYRPGTDTAWLYYRPNMLNYYEPLGTVGTVTGDVRLGIACLADQRVGATYYAHDDAAGNFLGDLLYSELRGNGVTTMPVATTGDVGRFSAMARGEQGYPQVAYYDATGDALKYSRYNGLAWDIATVALDGGEYCSLAIDADWVPHISYYCRDAGELRYATQITD
ncbi:PQQ-like beta-propeller repeat protein [bacterium]|nr:PQQ-like beta-propeller repeat protein [bacterium]